MKLHVNDKQKATESEIKNEVQIERRKRDDECTIEVP